MFRQNLLRARLLPPRLQDRLYKGFEPCPARDSLRYYREDQAIGRWPPAVQIAEGGMPETTYGSCQICVRIPRCVNKLVVIAKKVRINAIPVPFYVSNLMGYNCKQPQGERVTSYRMSHVQIWIT